MPRLLEALRRRRDNPETRLREFGLAKGAKVADIGAGYGYYAMPASEIVGVEGLVYAVEPDPKRAKEISERVAESEVKNVKVLEEGAEDIGGIPDGGVDMAIAMSSFHHFSDQGKALYELRRIVGPGGRIVVRDMKAGRIFKHGSQSGEFRSKVTAVFPEARFEETSGHVTADIRV